MREQIALNHINYYWNHF